MGRGRRKIAWFSLIPLLVIVGLAGSAFACEPQATMSVNPRMGPAGGTTTAKGESWDASTIELRWDSVSGQLLATAQGPTFETSVRIPDAPEGVHYIVAVGKRGRAAAAYEVTSTTTTTGGSSAAQPSETTTTTSRSEPSSSGGSDTQPSGGNTQPNAGGTQDPAPPAPPPSFPSPPSEGATGSGPVPIGSKSASAPSTTTVGVEVANIPTTIEEETTTTTIEDEEDDDPDDDREMAAPTPARSGWGPGAVGGLLALGGLLSLAGVVVGRKIGQRHRPEPPEPVEATGSEGDAPGASG